MEQTQTQEQEQWKTIIDFPVYHISSFGQVKNVKTNKILKQRFTSGYYQTCLFTEDHNSKFLYVHRLVAQYFCVNIIGSDFVDHIDNNRTNNYYKNLRWCTIQQNNQNKSKQKNTTSVYKGVCFFKKTNKWMAYIKVDNKTMHLGYFIIESEAAEAYNQKAAELFKDFAKLNII